MVVVTPFDVRSVSSLKGPGKFCSRSQKGCRGIIHSALHHDASWSSFGHNFRYDRLHNCGFTHCSHSLGPTVWLGLENVGYLVMFWPVKASKSVSN